MKEIENNYKNLNYSDRRVVRSLLSDISSIREREIEIEAANRIAAIASMIGKDVLMYMVHTSTGEADLPIFN